MLSRPAAARRRGMPEIAVLGKHFCFYKTWEKKSLPPTSNERSTDEVNKAAETRRLSSYHVNSRTRVRLRAVSRREDNPVQTGAADRFARAPCSFGDGLVGRVRLRRQNPVRRSFCGRRANEKSVFHQT